MQKFTAIVLTSRDIGEFDRMYFLYTRESGLVKAIGRGVRKPTAKLAGHLEPGTLSEVYIARSRGMGQITGAIMLENFDEVKKNFGTLNDILKIFRFFARNFAEGEKDEGIFDLLFELLGHLEKSVNRGGMPVEALWWKLFDLSGHRPETMKCAKCGAKLREEEKIFFSSAGGGVVCKECSKENGLLDITVAQIKLLRIIFANSLEKILKVKIDEEELGRLRRIREDFRKYNF